MQENIDKEKPSRKLIYWKSMSLASIVQIYFVYINIDEAIKLI